jgi:hypothetical protein
MKLRCMLMAVPIALVVAPAAFAAGSAPTHGYGGGAGVQNEVGGVQAAGGALPFTGLDLALLVIGGVLLLVVGMVLRRAVRRTT